MKKVFIIFCLLVFALPSYATFGYYEGCNDNIKPYDDNGTQAYAQKLEKEYWERVHRGECSVSAETYNYYVQIPIFEYIEKHPIDYNKKAGKRIK